MRAATLVPKKSGCDTHIYVYIHDRHAWTHSHIHTYLQWWIRCRIVRSRPQCNVIYIYIYIYIYTRIHIHVYIWLTYIYSQTCTHILTVVDTLPHCGVKPRYVSVGRHLQHVLVLFVHPHELVRIRMHTQLPYSVYGYSVCIHAYVYQVYVYTWLHNCRIPNAC